MREIIFRGKDVSTGKWLIGYYNMLDYMGGGGLKPHIKRGGCVPFEVDSETVGQYIGIKDSCGDSIFEGDVLLLDGGVGFVIWDNHGIGWALESPGSCAVDYPRKDDYERSKIIGNIHDNRNLLE